MQWAVCFCSLVFMAACHVPNWHTRRVFSYSPSLAVKENLKKHACSYMNFISGIHSSANLLPGNAIKAKYNTLSISGNNIEV